jgi:hypothetical protein
MRAPTAAFRGIYGCSRDDNFTPLALGFDRALLANVRETHVQHRIHRPR